MNPEDIKEKVEKCFGCLKAKCMSGCPLNMEIPKIMNIGDVH